MCGGPVFLSQAIHSCHSHTRCHQGGNGQRGAVALTAGTRAPEFVQSVVASPARLHSKAAVAPASPRFSAARLRQAIVPGIYLHILVARVGAGLRLRSPVADGRASGFRAGGAAESVLVAVGLLLLLRLLRSPGARQPAQPASAVARTGETFAVGVVAGRTPLRLRPTRGPAPGAVGDAAVLAPLVAARTRVPV